MRFLLIAALLASATATPALCADDHPMEMQHIALQISEDNPLGMDKPAVEKEFWRSGDDWGRIVLPTKARQRTNKALVFTPGNAWVIENESKQARHEALTTAPKVQFKVIEDHRERALSKLDFGNELAFFKERHAKKTTTIDKGIATDWYTLEISQKTLMLGVDQKTSKPVELTLYRPSDHKKWIFNYLAYETLPFDPTLFAPPAGYRVTEVDVAEAQRKQAESKAQKEASQNQLTN